MKQVLRFEQKRKWVSRFDDLAQQEDNSTSWSFFLLPLDSIGKRLSMKNNLEAFLSVSDEKSWSKRKEKKPHEAVRVE